MKEYDLIVIGAGPGGHVAALKAAQGGLSTCLIERERPGGACLNWGCIPSKSLLASAKLLEQVKRGREFGLQGLDFAKVQADWPAMKSRALKVGKGMSDQVRTLLEGSGVQIISGSAELLEPRRIKVGKQNLTAGRVILATGSHYRVPESLTAPGLSIHTPRTLYSMDRLPASLIIIGAGVVGVEFALLFSLLGVKVSLVEQKSTLMPYLDEEIGQALRKRLAVLGVELYTGWTARELRDGPPEGDPEGRTPRGVRIEREGEAEELEGQVVLYCGPRQASLEGLEALLAQGLVLRDGFIRTDSRARTSLPGIYAVGDVNGRFMLAHVAAREGVTAAETILGGGRDLVYDLMPYNMYGSPELASVGMTEQEALEAGFLTESATYPLSANGKALAQGDAQGFVKLVFDKWQGEILGFHLIGENATDLIGEAVVLMQTKTKVWEVAAAVHPHPSLSEAILEAIHQGLSQA